MTLISTLGFIGLIFVWSVKTLHGNFPLMQRIRPLSDLSVSIKSKHFMKVCFELKNVSKISIQILRRCENLRR